MASENGTSAIILAGGRSTRLGRDKASEPLGDRPLLQHVIDRVSAHVDEIVIVAAPQQALPTVAAPIPLRTIVDKFPGSGPLGGIYSGLTETAGAAAIVVACDMPLLCEPLIRHLIEIAAEADVIMPVIEYPEPLHAVYRRTCAEPIRERLEAGQLKITNFLGAVRVRYVREEECRRFDPELHSFMNANTEGELARIRGIASSGES